MVWQWNNDEAFGDSLPNQDPNGTGNQFVFNHRFPGQYYDVETGTHYNSHRDYDPTIGRYVESDPIGLNGGSFSTYVYVGGNPLIWFDVSGLSGRWEDVPGSPGTRVRIDPPHDGGGPQEHAHVQQNGDWSKANETVVNKDGTGSHGSDPDCLQNKVKKWLRKKGFNIKGFVFDFGFDAAREATIEQCNKGDMLSCSTLPWFGVDVPDGNTL